MSKYSIVFQKQANYVEHRTEGHIPNCAPAIDIFREDDEGKIIIVNPAPASKGNLYT